MSANLAARTKAFLEALNIHITGDWKILRGRLQKPSTPLTRRQREVLPLVLQGLSNTEITARLGIRVWTAEKHVGRLRRTLISLTANPLINSVFKVL